MRLLDSHLHLWDPAVLSYTWLEGPLDAAFGPAASAETTPPGAAPHEAVFVQAECVESQFVDEVRWVDAMADAVGVSAIVAGARLDRGPATTAHLAELAEFPRVVGVRHLLQSAPDGLAASADFQAGARELAARGWSFDACVRAEQLPQVASLAATVPDLRVVLDHLGKPAVGTASGPLAPTEDWVRDLHALARHPQVLCKLSGLPAEAGGDWDAEQVAPFLDVALDAFGPERLMWGSDWPVSATGPVASGDAHGYQADARTRWFQAVLAWAQNRGVSTDALLHDTAAGFYRR